MKTRIDVIRHGEPEGGHRYRGFSIDDPLTELGWQQMWAAVPDKPKWNRIVSSPLARCLDFSKALSEKFDIPLCVEDDFKEIGFGDWEGKTPEEIIASDPEALNHFYKDPVNNRPAGAEPLTTFSERVWDAYKTVTEKESGNHILIVGHAGVVRAIVANILGMSLDNVYSKFKIEYAAIISSIIEKENPPKLIIES